jgi:hypothetical protein
MRERSVVAAKTREGRSFMVGLGWVGFWVGDRFAGWGAVLSTRVVPEEFRCKGVVGCWVVSRMECRVDREEWPWMRKLYVLHMYYVFTVLVCSVNVCS